MPSITGRERLRIALIALGYLGVAWVSLTLRTQPENFTIVWPASGIFLAALLLSRAGLRPWLAGALFLADLGARAAVGDPLPIVLTTSVAMAGSAVLSVSLLRRFAGEPITFERVLEMGVWLAMSVVLSNGLMALLPAAASVLAGDGQGLWHLWVWLVVSAGLGNLIVTPLIVSWVTWWRSRSPLLPRAGALELTILCMLAPVVRFLVVGQQTNQELFALLPAGAVIPFVIWAGLRFGVRGVTTVMVELAALNIALVASSSMRGLIPDPDALNRLLEMELSISVLAAPMLLLAAAIEERTRTQATLKRRNRALELISRCNLEVLRSTDERQLFQGICRLAIEVGGYRLAWVGNAERDEEKRVVPVAKWGFDEGYLETAAISWADTERGRGPAGRAIRDNRPVVANLLETDPMYAPWRAAGLQRRFASSVALPLAVDNEVFGALMLYADRPGAFDADEVALLSELANDIAFGVSALRAHHDHDRDLEAIRVSEMRYRRLFESAQDGILILDAETGVIVDANPYLIELLEFSRDAVLGKHVWDLGALGDFVANQETFRHLREHGYVRYDDRALVTRTGRRVEVEFVSNVYRVDGQARHPVQRPRHDGESARGGGGPGLGALHEGDHQRTPDQGVLEGPGPDLSRLQLGLRSRRRPCRSRRHRRKERPPVGVERPGRGYQADDRRVIESGQPRLLIEESQTTPTGETLTLLTSKVPLRDATGEVTGVLGTYLDITPLKRAEQAETLLAMAVQQVGEAIVITDVEGTIIDVNPAFETTTGYSREEAIGQNPRMLKSDKHDAAFYRRMWATLNAGGVWRGQLTNRRKDGTFYIEEATISPVRDATGTTINYVAVKRDITEQEHHAVQVRRAQRLESIGTLAGGIAHDLNNALAPILMATQFLRQEIPDGAEDDLDLIEGGARRGASLVKQLLNFAKGAEGDRLPVRLRPVLEELERLIRSTFPKNINLRVICPPRIPAVLGDATQLHQVLLNLCLNARDAMPEGGDLTLEVGVVGLEASEETEALGVAPGRFVVIRVADTGEGIPPDVVERIFEPFFTTKSADKGTGLGLATAMGIIKGHGGIVRVYSVVGTGTTFRVYLPVHATDGATATLPTPIIEKFQGAGQVILVVDDDSAVREILRRVLTRMGFSVRTASNGTVALHEVAEHRAELAAVITDLHMPELDGLAFVRGLRVQSPEIGVVVMSGLVGEAERDELTGLGVRAIIGKPFTQAELIEALRVIFTG